MSNIGEKIKLYRKRAGISQAKLAEEIGYTQSAVYSWEKGKAIPPLATLEEIAIALEVNFFDLVDLKNDGELAEQHISKYPFDSPSPAERAMGYISSLLIDFTEEGINKVITYIEDLSGNPKYNLSLGDSSKLRKLFESSKESNETSSEG